MLRATRKPLSRLGVTAEGHRYDTVRWSTGKCDNCGHQQVYHAYLYDGDEVECLTHRQRMDRTAERLALSQRK